MKMVTICLLLAVCSMGFSEQAKNKPRPKAVKPSPTPTPQAIVSIEAGLVFKSRDVKPVAREAFYLLDADLGQILFDAGLTPPPHARPATTSTVQAQLVNSFGVISVNQYAPENYHWFEKAEKAIVSHIIKKTTTDFTGKATFEPVKPGSYYLIGVVKTPNACAVWNLKVDAKSGLNLVTLDQHNANYAE